MVVDVDFGYGFENPSEVSARVKLKAGLHPLRLYYVRGTNGKPDLKWSGPGIAKSAVPAGMFFDAKDAGGAR